MSTVLHFRLQASILLLVRINYNNIGSADQTIRLWDVKNCTKLFKLKGHNGAVLSIAFSPCSQILASGIKDNKLQKVLLTSLLGYGI